MRPSSRELRGLFAETCATPGAEPQPGFTLLLEHPRSPPSRRWPPIPRHVDLPLDDSSPGPFGR
jgi:hypothetical protein